MKKKANKTLHPTAGNAPVCIRASNPAVDELDVLPNKFTKTNTMAKLADYTITGKSGTKYTFGMYAYPGSWNSVACVYIITKREVKTDGKGYHTHIYVGETEDLADRHDDHHKSDCFEKHGGNCIGILMEKGGQRRLDIETDIRNNGDKWPCNDQ
jgi:hypothetical protein